MFALILDTVKTSVPKFIKVNTAEVHLQGNCKFTCITFEADRMPL